MRQALRAAMASIRRMNLRRLAEEAGSQDALAQKLDVSGAYLSQLLTGKRPVTEKTARKFETRLRLPERWLDIDHGMIGGFRAPTEAQELLELILSLPSAERDFWIRTIRTAPRQP